MCFCSTDFEIPNFHHIIIILKYIMYIAIKLSVFDELCPKLLVFKYFVFLITFGYLGICKILFQISSQKGIVQTHKIFICTFSISIQKVFHTSYICNVR